MARILAFPLMLIWRLTRLIVEAVGRLLAVVIGFVFLVVGTLLTLTGIGAIVGVPLLILGLALIVKGVFG
ncbi:hypothetical protein [Sphaerobacter thermophilus]|uniref:Uncharacterized protein n=1 Tax=Sphaerobacter thermophilus (strain ATCC 49802 / DSM 20745 / KCCM 41009 / NCIMB 13125 / S 6022) TaxID=479434 RepID=D1C4Z9_SPHTD|nr:hypothetical protein [Sphaerobacter thermophilus]ACZ39316.1 hypothetical protein Sthe_1883 [Sphaerobacter thermophilus DSM 20745]PZN65694.1 MAG: hypothetical protein DIU58_06835 [Sphaerobacter thermophilus]